LAAAAEKGAEMVLSRLTNRENAAPTWGGLTWPSWSWFDEMFHDGEWHRPFSVEERRDDESIYIRAELPGVDPDKDVKVEVVDDELVITAQKSESQENKGRHVHRSEFRYGSLTRSIPIPRGVDESQISATYKDGVLEVRVAVPSGSVETAHRIEIKRG
jgi:HSP20 family protein